MTALSVIYQVIGGAGIPLITSFAGLVIGGVAGLKDGSPKEIVTKTLTGGAVGAWVGGGLGIPAATKLRAAGITQIAVGITLGAWFWWARGRVRIPFPQRLWQHRIVSEFPSTTSTESDGITPGCSPFRMRR